MRCELIFVGVKEEEEGEKEVRTATNPGRDCGRRLAHRNHRSVGRGGNKKREKKTPPGGRQSSVVSSSSFISFFIYCLQSRQMPFFICSAEADRLVDKQSKKEGKKEIR